MALTYLNNGQITRQKYNHLGEGSLTQDYGYDDYRRLTGFSEDNGLQTIVKTWQYDSVGNRKRETRQTFETDYYTYQAGKNRLSAVTGATLADTMNYDADGALLTRKKEHVMGNNNYLGVDKETFGYNYAGVVRRYERTQNYQTLGSCADPIEETSTVWKYRYNGGAEREIKRLASADLLPDIAKNWVYYQLGADKRQHGVYNGRETSALDACSSFVARVHWFPTEYLLYGLGSTPLISYKPFAEGEETYYIADHLGNTRVTLSSNGNIISAKDFEPFGKELHSNGSDRLTFIGKETDAESNLGDFGVRKYEAEYGRFLSVDRFWEQYNSYSTYNYSVNNPLIVIDPTGDIIQFPDDIEHGGTGALRKLFNKAYNYIKQKAPEQAKILEKLMNSTEIFKIRQLGGNDDQEKYDPKDKRIDWNPFLAAKTLDGKNISPALNLLHEAGHAADHLDRVLGPYATDETKKSWDDDGYSDGTDFSEKWDNRNEYDVINNVQNPAALKLGEGTRNDHKGYGRYKVNSPISRTPVKPKK